MKTSYILGSIVLGVLVVLGVTVGLVVGGVVGTGVNKLVIASASADMLYSGEALTCSDWEIKEGELLEGHSLSVTVYGSRSDAGQSENSLSAIVVDAAGTDVTADYTIEYAPGTLTVMQRRLELTTASASKQYDGEPLNCVSYQLTMGELVQGHALQITMGAERVEVGETENKVIAQVVTQDGTDVTHNYAISCLAGELIVTPHAITVQSAGAEKTYDGMALTCDTVEMIAGTLMEGHTLSMIATGTRTDAGTSDNTFGVEIKDAKGNNVTQNYTVTAIFGELTVRPIAVTVRSADASKDYDGKPLTCAEWSVVSQTNVLAGHTLEVVVSGTRTEPGETQNSIAECIVTDGDGQNVTHNYVISTELGALVVNGGSSTGGEDDEGDVGGGGDDGSGGLDQSGQIGGGSGEASVLVAKVYATETRRVYLRTWSRGDYLYNCWDTSPASYGELIGSVYSMNYLTGIALQSAGYARMEMRIEPVQSLNYLLPYYMEASEHEYDVQTDDVRFTATDPSAAYAVYYYAYDHQNVSTHVGTLPAAYSSVEEAYRDFVYDTYLNVPLSTYAAMQKIIEDNNFSKDDKYIVRTVASYVQNAATYNLNYPEELDAAADVAVAFLTEYKEGICQHYATAATLLFRSLGIPARYTEGYVVNAIEGQWVELTSETAHAWVEVYLDGVGWVNVEVTAGIGDGFGGSGEDNGDDTDDSIVIRPTSKYLQIDEGDRLVASTLSSTNGWLEELLAQGYTVDFELEGEQNGVGKTTSSITRFLLFDPDGEDVTEEYIDRYKIKFKKGILHIYIKKLEINGGAEAKVYDSFPLLPDQTNYTHGELISADHQLQVFFTNQLTEVGKLLNYFTVKVVDKTTGEDVSDQYWINCKYDYLTVAARTITVTSGSAQKAYDGTALRCSEYTYAESELCDGHKLELLFEGEQTALGRSKNLFTARIVDAQGNDVSKNYHFILNYGWLRVVSQT